MQYEIVFQKLAMEIRIEAGKSFNQIQQLFNDVFPYLKIECLNNYNRNKNIDEHLFIIVNNNTTVAELVNQFKEIQNCTVKVLRRSNNLWIETSLTDSWTLEKQNMAGKQFNAS